MSVHCLYFQICVIFHIVKCFMFLIMKVVEKTSLWTKYKKRDGQYVTIVKTKIVHTQFSQNLLILFFHFPCSAWAFWMTWVDFVSISTLAHQI